MNPQSYVGKVPCERCDVARWRLWITPWGFLCTACQGFVPPLDIVRCAE